MPRFLLFDALLWALLIAGIGLEWRYLDVSTPGILVSIAVSALILSGLMWFWRPQVVEMLIFRAPKVEWLLLALSAAGKVLFLSLQGEDFLAGLWAVAAVSVYGFIVGLLVRKDRVERHARH